MSSERGEQTRIDHLMLGDELYDHDDWIVTGLRMLPDGRVRIECGAEILIYRVDSHVSIRRPRWAPGRTFTEARGYSALRGAVDGLSHVLDQMRGTGNGDNLPAQVDATVPDG